MTKINAMIDLEKTTSTEWLNVKGMLLSGALEFPSDEEKISIDLDEPVSKGRKEFVEMVAGKTPSRKKQKKLTDKQKKKMLKRYDKGESAIKLSKIYGISYSTFYSIYSKS